MNLQRSSGETSIIQRLSHQKHKRSILFASNSSLFHQLSLKKSSSNHHWSRTEKSMFRRLAQRRFYDHYFLHRNLRCFNKASSKKITKESSLKQHWNVNASKLSTIKSIMINSVPIEISAISSISVQKINNKPSRKQQWNINDSEISTLEALMML